MEEEHRKSMLLSPVENIRREMCVTTATVF